MPRFIRFENVQNVTGSCCHGLINAALEPHKNTLYIDIKNCVYDFNGENKIITIAIKYQNELTEEDKKAAVLDNDRNELTDEELEQHLRLILSDYLPAGETTTKKNHYHPLQAMLGLILGGVFMLLMWQEIELPDLHLIMTAVGTVATLIIGRASFYKAWLGLKRWKFNMDSLFAMSAIAAILVSVAHVTLEQYIKGLPMLIDAPLMIFGFRHFGLWLRESFVDKIQNREKFVDRARKSTFKIKQGEIYVSYQSSSIKPHEVFKDICIEKGKQSIIEIQPGECIPLNGILLDKCADVTFTIHTGQLDPIRIEKNKMLYAGMIVTDKPLTMKVTDSEVESYLHARDIALIKAQISKAPIQDLTDKMTQYFAPGSFIAAIAVGAVAGYFQGIATAIAAGLYVAVCMCPCALGLVTPLAIGITMGKVRDKGYRFNTEKGVQAAAAVNTLIFDLNGTLTKNKPTVTSCTVDKSHFSVLHAIESRSPKPIAKSIADYARSGNTPSCEVVFSHYVSSHNGVTAVVDGDVYEIGNEEFFNYKGLPPIANMGTAQHAIYYKKNGLSLGYILVDDPLREDAAWMVDSLKKNNINVKIATGASLKTVRCYLPFLGLTEEDVIVNCKPADKAALVQNEKDKGHTVVVVGDSANDTEAIAAAHLGVVINSPSTDPMTTQSADASINTPTLYPVLEMLALGKQSMRLVYTNLLISFGYNILSLGYVGYAAFSKPEWLNPSFGAVSMVGQTMCLLAIAFCVSLMKPRLAVVVPQKQEPTSQSITHDPHHSPSPSKVLRFSPEKTKPFQESGTAPGCFDALTRVFSSFRS